jgi:hypothetical protein
MAKRGSHVFISYSRADSSIVQRLVERLARGGIRVWRDVAEISPGQDWPSLIESAVESANAFIWVSSGNSGRSGWMAHELEAFASRGTDRPLIPVIVDNEGERRLPEILRSRQWFDLRPDFERGAALIVATLRDTLPKTAIASPASAPPPRSKGYVFISYAEEDSALVKDVKEYLKSKGYAYWDFSESERDYQVQFFLELESVIRESKATLSILTPSWKQSKWTTKEYLFSEETGVPVFLLKMLPLEATLLIAGVPFIDFVKSKSDGFKKLDRELERRGL